MELIYGARNKNEASALDAFLSAFPVEPLSDAVEGQPIPGLFGRGFAEQRAPRVAHFQPDAVVDGVVIGEPLDG